MKRKLNILLLSVLVLTLSRCTETLPEDELPSFFRQLVVNSVASTSEPFWMELTASQNPYRLIGSTEFVTGAEVSFRVNGTAQNLVYNDITDLYESDYTPGPGDEISLSVNHEQYATIGVNTAIPKNLENRSAKLEVDGGRDINGDVSDLISITFRDKATEQNFYMIEFLYYDEFSGEYNPFQFPISDPTLLSASTIKTPDESGYIVKDDLFNGQNKTFSAVAPFGFASNNSDIKYLIRLSSLSPDYWRYLESLKRYRDEADVGSGGLFNSAVVIHSNVSGGLGILGTINSQSDTLR